MIYFFILQQSEELTLQHLKRTANKHFIVLYQYDWLTCTEWFHCSPAAVKRYFQWPTVRSWVVLSSKNRAAASPHHWEVCVVREKLLMWACSIQDESACARTSSQQEDSHSKDERNERHVLRHKKKTWIHSLTKTKTFQRMNSVKRMTRV